MIIVPISSNISNKKIEKKEKLMAIPCIYGRVYDYNKTRRKASIQNKRTNDRVHERSE